MIVEGGHAQHLARRYAQPVGNAEEGVGFQEAVPFLGRVQGLDEGLGPVVVPLHGPVDGGPLTVVAPVVRPGTGHASTSSGLEWCARKRICHGLCIVSHSR